MNSNFQMEVKIFLFLIKSHDLEERIKSKSIQVDLFSVFPTDWWSQSNRDLGIYSLMD